MTREKKNKAIGIRTPKAENFSEWYSQVCGLTGAELVDVNYGVGGLLVHLPNAVRIIRSIYQWLEKEVEDRGHEPVIFPTLIREQYLTLEKEHAGFTPEVFWVEAAGTKKIEERLALRPTGETQFYPMYARWIRSHSQLPFRRYQSRHTVFRYELSTRPFLRGREFLFFETHNCFASHEQVMTEITHDMETMRKVIWGKLKIPHLFLKRPQWDKFKGAEDTYVADTIMPDGKRNQISSTHDLGQRFAKPFGIKFSDPAGVERYVYQNCFGPGIWRIMAALIGIHGDDKGLVLPFDVAPIQIVIIPILSSDVAVNSNILAKCAAVEESLRAANYRPFIDATDRTPGFKFNEWEMKGVPLRIEIGRRDIDKGSAVINIRVLPGKVEVADSNLVEAIATASRNLDVHLEDSAGTYFADKIHDAETLDAAIAILDSAGGFVRVPFCSIGADGEQYGKILQEKTRGAYVCGVAFQDAERPRNRKCIVSGNEATELVYIARSH
ncbi:MAG: proline--tRNA ligase [Acidobacteria bacterium]|nr:proline--tRNA ligase [Acidobacteriota bacterium]